MRHFVNYIEAMVHEHTRVKLNLPHLNMYLKTWSHLADLILIVKKVLFKGMNAMSNHEIGADRNEAFCITLQADCVMQSPFQARSIPIVPSVLSRRDRRISRGEYGGYSSQSDRNQVSLG
jgi:hypothetical protein